MTQNIAMPIGLIAIVFIVCLFDYLKTRQKTKQKKDDNDRSTQNAKISDEKNYASENTVEETMTSIKNITSSAMNLIK